MSLMSDPRLQRDIQKLSAKGFATGNRAQIGKAVGAHAARAMQTKLNFKHLGLQKMLNDRTLMFQDEAIRQQGREITQAHQRLREIDKMGSRRRLQTGLGMFTHWQAQKEAKRRANIIEQQAARQDVFHKSIKNIIDDIQGKKETE
jgi:hypothetical protein